MIPGFFKNKPVVIMKKFIPFCLFFLSVFVAFGQVQYQIEWQETNQTYVVSLVSQATWESPQNITSTAQITIKAPTGSFEPVNLTNLQPNVVFELNSRHDAPEEAPAFDYISFGLQTMGTGDLHYESGKTIPLFSFQNAGDCSGALFLVDSNDPFMPPNSKMANIANQITILGAQGNAWVGNVGEGKADCSFSTGTKDETLLARGMSLFPNPVKDQLFVTFEWAGPAGDMEAILYDVLGKEAWRGTVQFAPGANRIRIDMKDLRAGVYSLRFEGGDFEHTLQRVVKN
ncbi:MAG: T9SS C-terminal target domain-containing protein [Bacteroidetes bacterium]|nr:MAG: T9SS C-terminal target domain-containing protein [Bacteroidota bacterium]